jgi:hypothetical protein
MIRTGTSPGGSPVVLAVAGLVGGAARAALLGAAAPPALANSYLAVLTVASRARRRRPDGIDDAAAGHRIAVLVPAHDEERGIGATVDSIVGQDYPAALRTVHVVADNCTDQTAAVARHHGAEVHVRDDPQSPGKGPALGWLVRRVLADGPPPDAFVVIDADTTMHPSFLRQVDAALGGPRSVWQGYYTVRDPDLAPSTAFRHAALILRHYIRPLGRTALGGSTGLFGNGMVFRSALLARRGFSAHLTEDMELQLELLLDGELVGFLPEAVVEAEMPTTLAGAASQNERWEAGRLQLARRFVPELTRRALGPGTAHRAAHVDAALDQLVPPLSVLGAVTGAVAAAACLPRMGRSGTGRIGRRLAWASVAALAFHVLAGLRWAGAPRATYRALLGAPQMAWWKVRLWLRVLARPDEVRWTRTPRNQP